MTSVRIYKSKTSDAVALSGFGRPFGLGVDSSQRLYVTDMDLHAVFRFDPTMSEYCVLDGKSEHWGATCKVELGRADPSKARDPGRFNGPHSIAFHPSGDLYITTYYQPMVHIYTNDGRSRRQLGGVDSSWPLLGPATAFFDRMGRLLVTEYRQHAIIAYDRDGFFCGALGMNKAQEPCRFGVGEQSFVATARLGGFDRPHMCKVDPSGFLVVADTWNNRLQRFTEDGRLVAWLNADTRTGEADAWVDVSTEPPIDSTEHGLKGPVSVDFCDQTSQMLVSDWGNDRVVLFDLNGKLLHAFDTLGLRRPYDSCFIGPNLIIADSHNSRILVLPRPCMS